MDVYITREEYELLEELYERLRSRLPSYLQDLKYDTLVLGKAKVYTGKKVYSYIQLKGLLSGKKKTLRNYPIDTVDLREVRKIIKLYRAVRALKKAYQHLSGEGLIEEEENEIARRFERNFF